MSDTPDRPSDLSRIFDEFLGRCQLGESPDLDEYCQRFPDLAEQLRLHIGLYDALGEAGPAGGWGNRTAAPVAISPAAGFTNCSASSTRKTWPPGEPDYRDNSNSRSMRSLPPARFRY